MKVYLTESNLKRKGETDTVYIDDIGFVKYEGNGPFSYVIVPELDRFVQKPRKNLRIANDEIVNEVVKTAEADFDNS